MFTSIVPFIDVCRQDTTTCINWAKLCRWSACAFT